MSEQTAVRNRQRAVLAESARQQARVLRDNKHSRAKEAEAAHRERLQRIAERKERGVPMDDSQDKLPTQSRYQAPYMSNIFRFVHTMAILELALLLLYRDEETR